MRIFEYKKHFINEQVVDPNFITNGNLWHNPYDDTYIAVLPDRVPYYLPDTLSQLTEEQLIERMKIINSSYPFKKRIGIMGSGGYELDENMDDMDVEDMIREWCKVQEKL